MEDGTATKNKDINPTEVTLYCPSQVADVFVHGQVSATHSRSAALAMNFLRQGFQCVAPARHQANFSTMVSEVYRNRTADTAAGAGHNGDLMG
jgi:hypothetical protein